MIGYLTGKAQFRSENRLLVVTNGIGYEVVVSQLTSADIVLGCDISLFIHTHVREDELSLYGFLTRDELVFFRLLISVSGIGPKLALGILQHPVDKVKSAILLEDVAFLTQLPGIGKKTAGRLVLDLKSKVEVSDLASLQHHRALDRDTVDALVHLGYDKGFVTRVLSDAPADLVESEGLIRYFLQHA